MEWLRDLFACSMALRKGEEESAGVLLVVLVWRRLQVLLLDYRRSLLFFLCLVHIFLTYLRVTTHKRVVFSTKSFKEFVSMLKVWNPGYV